MKWIVRSNSSTPVPIFVKQNKFLTILGLAAMSAFAPQLLADYPIASHRYLADPTSLVTKDRVYIYCSNDDESRVEGSYNIPNVICVSSSDMKNWTDHGSVFRASDSTTWAKKTWAPAADRARRQVLPLLRQRRREHRRRGQHQSSRPVHRSAGQAPDRPRHARGPARPKHVALRSGSLHRRRRPGLHLFRRQRRRQRPRRPSSTAT